MALAAILTNAGLNLLGPFIIGYVIDHYVVKRLQRVLLWAGILLAMYVLAAIAGYLQSRLMGGVGSACCLNCVTAF